MKQFKVAYQKRVNNRDYLLEVPKVGGLSTSKHKQRMIRANENIENKFLSMAIKAKKREMQRYERAAKRAKRKKNK